jgi:CBS domain-containing protein
MRPYLGLDPAPLFSVGVHLTHPGLATLLATIVVGLSAGVMSLLLTWAVYAAEDAFHRLPIHWMWWPMIGGLAVGIGGYFEPRALGVGYDVIADLLRGNLVFNALIGLMVVKALIWAIALGSGTSGGVLAPLLMMGGMLGAIEATFLPGNDAPLWSLVAMGAVMGGTMRSPLTGVIFALEITYDIRMLLPLLIATIIAHGFTVLVMRRSILTEKVARRGFHVSREYSVDPLERLSVEEVMSTDVVTVHCATPVKELLVRYFLGHGATKHQGYPVVDDQNRLLGVVTKADLLEEWMPSLLDRSGADVAHHSPIITFDLVGREPIMISPDATCRTAAEQMAAFDVGRLIVVAPSEPERVVGIVTRSDLLKPRSRHAYEETRRERVFAPLGKRGASVRPPA